MLHFEDMNPALRIKCVGCGASFPERIYKTTRREHGMNFGEVWMCLHCMWKHNQVTDKQPNKSRMMANNQRHQDDILSRILAPDGRTVLRLKN